ncbi:MAG: polysulfide reductase [Verrucomicrobia bacterium]|nr:MAG: polysulfide reductase [Verrucomicrobiota bacterium]
MEATPPNPKLSDQEIERDILAPLRRPPGRVWWASVVLLAAVFVWGLVAWAWQIHRGLGVTGMNAPVFWGFYIINFVFFIGISHAGTLVSAILRLTKARWRYPLTRVAEAITLFSLPFGAMSVVVDLGRPDRLLNVIHFPHLTSPILWDVICISTYLVGSATYLYLPLIPDIALCRDKLTEAGPFKRWLYRIGALGWTGTARQAAVLEKAVAVMAVLITPIAVSVHTVVSWIFATTANPMWHSTIFGPYFVVGAIYSGIGALVVAMTIMRRAWRLEKYLTPHIYDYLGQLFLVMCCLWTYFTFGEYLITYLGRSPTERVVWMDKFVGAYAWPFWGMIVACLVIPMAVLCRKRTRTPGWMTFAASAVLLGMWLERYLIVVPTKAHPFLSWGVGHYKPSWVEWSVLASWCAGFALAFFLFFRLYPCISVWEIKEGQKHE